MQGATLTIDGGSLSGGGVTAGEGGGGAAGTNGAGGAFGSGIFLQGDQSLSFDPAAGATETVSDVIADQNGSESGYAADQGGLIVDGGGALVLDPQAVTAGSGGALVAVANTFTGGISLEAGTLELGNAQAAGTGAITFVNDPTLAIDGTTMPTNVIADFARGDSIDLKNVAFTGGGPSSPSPSATQKGVDVVSITEGGQVYSLNFDTTVAGMTFVAAADASGDGTLITELTFSTMTAVTWTGATSSDWNDPTNWSPPGVPGAGDTITIPATAPNNPVIGLNGWTEATVYGDVVNNGVITIGDAAATGQSYLSIDGNVTLSGSGSLVLAGDSQSTNEITSFTSGSTLDNQQTISGAGLINSIQDLSIVNDATGVIDANDVGALEIEETTGGIFANDGLLEATNATAGNGGLVLLDATIDQTGDGDSGKIEANGANAVVTIDNSTIEGGQLSTSGNGQIAIDGTGNVFDGTTAPLTITANSVVNVGAGRTLTLASSTGGQGGVIDNSGTIALAGGTSGGVAILDIGTVAGGVVTLQGGGQVTLNDTFDNQLASTADDTTLDNIDDTISGAGSLTPGYDPSTGSNYSSFSITNETNGVIEATYADEPLLVQNLDLTNDGLLEATNATAGNGGLVLVDATVDQTGDGDSGKIEANGANAVVTIDNSTIEGGQLSTSGDGQIALDGVRNVFDGTTAPLTITANSVVNVGDQALTLASSTGGQGGVIDNSGTIALAGGASSGVSHLEIGTVAGGVVTLQGGGQVTLNDTFDNLLFSTADDTTLDNIDDTISGAGIVSTGSNYSSFSITNETNGVIEATYADEPLRVQNLALTNDGVLRADNGATLALIDSLTNIAADPINPGGSVLTGGTYDLIDPTSGGASTIAITGGVAAPITTLDAEVDLAGATSTLTSDGASLASSLLDVGASGALNLYYGDNSQSQQVFDDSANPLTIDGYVSLDAAELESETLTIDASGALYALGDFEGAAGETPVSAELSAANGVVNDGQIIDYGLLSSNGLDARFVVDDAISGAGAISITGDSILELAGAVSSGQKITFANSQTTGSETLQIDTADVNVAGGAFQSTISGMEAGDPGAGTGDFIDLSSIAYESGGQVSLNASDDVLTVTENSQTYTLQLASTFNGEYFHLASDGGDGAPAGAAGTLIYADASPCYCEGTRILTERGEVAVEDLRVGDMVITASGALRPIVWIGFRQLDIGRHAFPLEVMPVRVRAGAFGLGKPHRDLWLSPQHAVFVEGVLIPIIRLANGANVAQIRADSITYFHVELESHDILLAEGLPAESFLDCGSRSGFSNCGDFVELHPTFKPLSWDDACAPLKEEGEEVEAVRARLLAQAEKLGFRQSGDPGLHIRADGDIIWPERREGGWFDFVLPEGAREMKLASRSWRPADAAASGDKRHLGVVVREIEIDGRRQDLGALGAGWHPLEGEAGHEWRWTDGSAALPVGARRIAVRIGDEPLYWVEAEAQSVQRTCKVASKDRQTGNDARR